MKEKTGPSKPSAACRIEVRLKAEFADAEGAAALARLNGLGLNTAREVRTSHLYELRGSFNSGHIQQAVRELLCDAVTQEHRILSPAPPVMNGMTHWRVEVWLKDSVSDPVGESVRAALAELGLPPAEGVRVAKVFRITGKCGRAQLERLVPRALANPLIHRFTVEEAHP